MRPEDVVIPEEALSETFLAATGPGGQNVNKVATAVQLRADVSRLGLDPKVRERLERLKSFAGIREVFTRTQIVDVNRFPHNNRYHYADFVHLDTGPVRYW